MNARVKSLVVILLLFMSALSGFLVAKKIVSNNVFVYVQYENDEFVDEASRAYFEESLEVARYSQIYFIAIIEKRERVGWISAERSSSLISMALIRLAAIALEAGDAAAYERYIEEARGYISEHEVTAYDDYEIDIIANHLLNKRNESQEEVKSLDFSSVRSNEQYAE